MLVSAQPPTTTSMDLTTASSVQLLQFGIQTSKHVSHAQLDSFLIQPHLTVFALQVLLTLTTKVIAFHVMPLDFGILQL